jgi:pectate lyase
MDRPATRLAISNGVMRFFTAVVAVLAVATVVGLVEMSPGDVETPLAEGFARVPTSGPRGTTGGRSSSPSSTSKASP